jgi:TPR repeat protein
MVVIGTAVAEPLEDATAARENGDYATALKLLRPLADQGVAEAEFNLGLMYAQGQGVQQDDAEALNWCRKAADQGDADAQVWMIYGRGLAPRYAEAMKWYWRGITYSNGYGVPQDDAKAMKLYRLAADYGLAGAQYTLGMHYENGIGVPQDYSEAVKWYRLAADQGHAQAQSNLGLMYAAGHGVAQDYVSAYIWLNLAAAQFLNDREKTVNARDLTAAKLTPAQIAEAQKFTREWKPKPER